MWVYDELVKKIKNKSKTSVMFLQFLLGNKDEDKKNLVDPKLQVSPKRLLIAFLNTLVASFIHEPPREHVFLSFKIVRR